MMVEEEEGKRGEKGKVEGERVGDGGNVEEVEEEKSDIKKHRPGRASQRRKSDGDEET